MKHSYEDELKCPYCNWIDDEPYEYFERRYNDTIEVECPACEKKFHATQNHTVDYSTVGDCKLNGELPHTLKSGFGRCYSCTKCFEEFWDWELAEGNHPKLKKEEYEILPDTNKDEI